MVDSIYAGFLNLDHRPDRLAHMNSELDKINLRAIRHRGRLPEEFDLNRPELATMRNRTPGAIGCHFGQVEIMQTALSLDLHALVLEDDCVFCSDFHERLKIIEAFHVEHDWDIVWLGASFHVNPPFWHPFGPSKMNPDCSAQLGRDAELTDNPRMIRTYGAFATFAYIVNAKSIQKILDLLNKNLAESIGIDWLMIKLQPQLKCFAFVPGCVKQMDGRSDIGNGDTIWSGFLRLNGTMYNSGYVWQDKITDFNPLEFNWMEANI
jgi:GR25 family glycosyltransferase involved in LPS biosynthesis